MLEFSAEIDINRCEQLWKQFSPDEFLFDLWEVRRCFFDEEFHLPHFIVSKENSELKGIVPLWKDKRKNYYEFFGGEFAERNRFFLKDEKLLPQILAKLPEPVWLSYIDSSEASHQELAESTKRYYISLSKFGHSFDNYLSSFSKKHRKNLRRDLRILEQDGYSVCYNRLTDTERMVSLSIERFKADSFFADPVFAAGFGRLIGYAHKMGWLHMISIDIGGKTEAVQIAVLYNRVYYVLLGGSNLKIQNIGKLMIAEHIRNAIALKADVVDFLSTEGNWKELWNLAEDPVYEYDVA